MSKSPFTGGDPDVTRHELPALRHPPLDQRLPRLNCAPELHAMTAWAPLHSDEKTVVGDIPVLPSTASAKRRSKAHAKRATSSITLDRWVLLAFAIGTLGYSLHNVLPSASPSPRVASPTIAAPFVASTAAALSPNAADSIAAAPPLLHPIESPTAVIQSPLDPTALETAAAQAWLAGHIAEAAQLYRLLAALSPQAPALVAAAAIARAQLMAATVESP